MQAAEYVGSRILGQHNIQAVECQQNICLLNDSDLVSSDGITQRTTHWICSDLYIRFLLPSSGYWLRVKFSQWYRYSKIVLYYRGSSSSNDCSPWQDARGLVSESMVYIKVFRPGINLLVPSPFRPFSLEGLSDYQDLDKKRYLDFLRSILQLSPEKRPSASALLKALWLRG